MRIILQEEFKSLLALEIKKGISLTVLEISKKLDISSRYAEVYRTMLDNTEALGAIFSDQDVVQENIKLAKQKQMYQDSNRIERKSFRDYARIENALVSLNKAVIEKFDEIKFDISSIESDVIKIDGDQGIIHFTDAHFNELIDLKENTYDFEVAGKRLALFAAETKRFFGSYGIKKVVLAMTGDMINSDRRLDEKLNMATNRMTAAMLATNLIQYFINDLMNDFESMDVVYVTGNESRAFEFGFSDMVVTDNYDSVIFNMLKLVFKKTENVNFIDSNPVETVIQVNGKNVLLMHGTTLGAASQKSIQAVTGRYANKDIIIHYVLFGHIHFCNIGDTFARGGSLAGSNTYSEFALNLITKASQNLHVIRKDGTINNLRVELQNTDGVKGYPIQKDLDAYNAKSASKAHREYKVIEIESSSIRT